MNNYYRKNIINIILCKWLLNIYKYYHIFSNEITLKLTRERWSIIKQVRNKRQMLIKESSFDIFENKEV